MAGDYTGAEFIKAGGGGGGGKYHQELGLKAVTVEEESLREA